MINIFQPCLGQEELARIQKVFESNWIGKGNEVLEFEKQFALSLNSAPPYFTSTTCATEGLFLAMELFGIGEGDEVIVPSISFVAVGSAVLASGADLVLCDCNPFTLNVTVDDILEKITPRTRAVYVTHYGGVPCDMDNILDVCACHRIKVIEDAACAPRSFYKGKAAGTLGDMGVWSFDAMKILVTGDGGMIYLKDPDAMNRAKESLYLGLPNKQTSGMDSQGDNWWEYDAVRPARRAIMNNISGAIGLEQLKKLPAFIQRRREIDERYREGFKGTKKIKLPPEIPKYRSSSYYMFWIQTPFRDQLARYLKLRGIYTTFRYWPLHRIPLFEGGAFLTHASYAADNTLNLPLHQSLTDEEVDYIIDTIKTF
jgi:dTDP-4-amino-4,6-dideoxygalactose transaminase